jgi:hypothetical protein
MCSSVSITQDISRPNLNVVKDEQGILKLEKMNIVVNTVETDGNVPNEVEPEMKKIPM